MFKNYLKIAWRNIIHNKVYSVINILGLALGICACIVIFLMTNYELGFDKFHPDDKRIYRFVGELKSPTGETMFLNNVIPDVAGFQNQIPGFNATAAFHSYGGDIKIPEGNQFKKFDNHIDGTFSSTAIITWPSYFSIFQYTWLQGNPRALSEPFKVVLTESRARKYFGDIPLSEIIGKKIIYDDSLTVSVAGILEDWKERSDFNYTDFISISTATHSFLKSDIPTDDWSSLRPHNGSAFVKLSKGVTAQQVNQRLTSFIKSNTKLSDGKLTMYLQPLSDMHFTDEYRRGDDGDDFPKAYLPTLYALMGVALFILIIAVVNFVNLSTAQSIQRVKEIGVRKVMGSSKKHIMFQFLIETFALTFIAVMLSVLLVNPMLFLFKDFIPAQVSFNLFEENTFIFVLLITLVTTLLAGFYPAKVLSSYLPVLSLKGISFNKGTEKISLRKALIVFQFSMSLIFIISIIVINKQMQYMNDADKGFNANDIVTITKWRDFGKLKILSDNIKAIPGIQKVLLEEAPPMGFAQMSNTYKFKEGKNEITLHPNIEIGNEDYIPFYQMKLIAGRNMLHSDSINELVINETLVKGLGFDKPEDAIGKMLYSVGTGSDRPFPIVGVIADFHQGSFHDAIVPAIIENAPDDQKRSIAVKLAIDENHATDVKAIVSKIGIEWKKLYPNEPFDYTVLNEGISRLYGQEKKVAFLTRVSAIITIVISCMGLFGLALFTAKKRTKEIGIRKVLGAGVADISAMLSKDFLKLVFISILIATPIGYYFSYRWLQDFAFRTNISWWVFVLAGALAILIALCTVISQSIKAAITNPVKSLRTE